MTNILTKLKYNTEDREKLAFYPSETNKSLIDMYFGFKNVPKTNPPLWFETLKWGAGNGVEDSMVDILKSNGVVPEDYSQKEHGRIEIEREGVQINGYIDAKDIHGKPIEIKSINNKNKWDIDAYEAGFPKENYVAQLAIYMDALEVEEGYLFASTVDGLHTFWFKCEKVEKRKYKCGKMEVDLDKIYKRWSGFYQNNVLKDIEPEFEDIYKLPVEEIDWKEVSKGDISKARNGHKVVGSGESWRITYSDWKDLIVEKQGAELGYSQKEMDRIKELTVGYTNW